MIGGLPDDQRYLLWLALCKRYRFIYDFAVEVIYERFLRLDLQFEPAEYDRFFDRKAEWHPEVENVTPKTRKTQRQMLLQAMREAGVIDAGMRIIPALLSPALVPTPAADKTRALKEIDGIDKTLTELAAYENDILYPLATQQVQIDLDDGVKVNYAKFGKALRRIPGLSE